MRKTRVIASSFIAVFFLSASCASANEAFVNILELREQIPESWNESYDAYDRTIEINVDIIMPSATTVPVIQIQPCEAIEVDHFANMEIQDNNAGKFLVINHPNPLESPSKRIGVDNTIVALSSLSDNKDYAEENSLLYGEAKEIFADKLEEYGYGHLEFDIDMPHDMRWTPGYGLVVGRLVDSSNGNAYGEKGYYWLAAMQKLHDIPIWTDIRWTFKKIRNEAMPDLGRADIALDSIDGGYSLCVKAVEEVETLAVDVPLCPFDRVIETFEEEIYSGRIRDADQLVFAYVYFRDSSKELVCFPCWILRCQYVNDPKKEPATIGEGLAWQDTSNSISLVVNAQTGELIDPYATNKERDRLPDFISWEEVQ